MKQKQWLRAQDLVGGYDDYSLAPGVRSPLGEGAYLDLLRKYFRSIRLTTFGNQTTIPADASKMRSCLVNGQSVAIIEANVKLCAGTGGVFSLTIYDVVSGSTDGALSVSVTTLGTLLDYAATLGFVFRTWGEWLARR